MIIFLVLVLTVEHYVIYTESQRVSELSNEVDNLRSMYEKLSKKKEPFRDLSMDQGVFDTFTYLQRIQEEILEVQSRLLSKSSPTRPRCVFVDAGANIGDSFRVFMREKSKFEFTYPIPEGMDPIECESYLFEASPVHTPALKTLEQEYKTRSPPAKLTVYPATAVWIKDSTMPFYLDTINPKHDFWGSSLNPSHPDSIKSGKHYVNVTTVNIADFLLRNFLPQDHVILKVDIEGAEV